MESIEVTIKESRSQWFPQLLATLIACLASVSMGFGFAYPSPAIPQLIEDKDEGGFGLSQEQVNWFASIFFLGGIIGGPLNIIILEKLGRKYGVLLSGLPFALGWFMIAFAVNVSMLYIGRVVTGIGCGMAAAATPVYIAEITEKEIRGRMGSCFQLATAFGVILAFCFGLAINYKWLAALGAAIAISLVISAIFLPESPRWYITKQKAGKATKSLQWLRGKHTEVHKEIEQMDTDLQNMDKNASFCEIVSMSLYCKPLLISVGLMCIQQFSGINVTMVYANTILKDADLGGKTEEIISTVTIAIMQFVFTLVTCAIIDRVGRRFLLIGSGIFLITATFMIAVYYLLTINDWVDKTNVFMKILSVGGIGLFISGFSFGVGPVPWILMSEIFDQRARDISSGISSACNWACAFLITRFYLTVAEAIYPYGAFFAFLGVNVVGVILYVIIPETKGKSLEEMHMYFK